MTGPHWAFRLFTSIIIFSNTEEICAVSTLSRIPAMMCSSLFSVKTYKTREGILPQVPPSNF